MELADRSLSDELLWLLLHFLSCLQLQSSISSSAWIYLHKQTKANQISLCWRIFHFLFLLPLHDVFHCERIKVEPHWPFTLLSLLSLSVPLSHSLHLFLSLPASLFQAFRLNQSHANETSQRSCSRYFSYVSSQVNLEMNPCTQVESGLVKMVGPSQSAPKASGCW